jgi:hypothetical protein
MKRPRSTTAWLRAIRVVVTLLLVSNVLFLAQELILVRPHVGTIATVHAGDIFNGDAYVHRLHPELRVDNVTVSPNEIGPDNHRNHVPAWQAVLWLLTHHVAFALAAIPMLVLARRLLDAVVRSDPFTLDIVRRLRVLGWVVLIGGALSEIAEYVAARILVNSFIPAGFMREWAEPDTDITLWWVMPAFILLAVAEVVRRGCVLRDELDTVI